MIRKLIVAAAVAVVLVTPVEAKRAFLSYTPLEKFVRSDAVVVGKVTAIEKDAVSATPAPGVPEKVAYKIAVVKVETGLVGAANATHVKVAFIPPAPVAPGTPVRPGLPQVNLTEGTEGLFYLVKHHSADFYVATPLLAPADSKADDYKAQVEQAKKCAAIRAEPMKALKSDKAEDRFFAAFVLVSKYRAFPQDGAETDTAKVPADESKLILKALAEGNWKQERSSGNPPNSMQAFGALGITDKDGWKYPEVKPGEDFTTKTKEAFAAWVAGPGKDYQINKVVPKKMK